MVTFWGAGAGGAQHPPPEHCQLPAPTNCSVGGTSKPLQGEEDSVTDMVMCCFMGLKFNFSSSRTTFLMLLFKCCSRICHYICSNCTCLLWRQMQWASIGISALPGRAVVVPGAFCAHTFPGGSEAVCFRLGEAAPSPCSRHWGADLQLLHAALFSISF